MKKILIIFLGTLFVLGCGKKKSTGKETTGKFKADSAVVDSTKPDSLNAEPEGYESTHKGDKKLYSKEIIKKSFPERIKF